MATQQVNTYAFNVKRISLMTPPITPTNSVAGNSPGAAYNGEQVFITAANLTSAQAMLAAVYGTDLGPVSGGAQVVQGAWTTLA